MPVVSNTRHELFAQGLARGQKTAKAYVAAGYAEKGARQNATRLSRDPQIRARVEELKTQIAADVIAVEISHRNARMQVRQDLVDRLLQVIDARAKDPMMAAVPGGSTGLLVCASKGKNTEVPVYRVDTALVAEVLALLRQAAEEEHGQEVEKREEKVDIASILNEGRQRMLEIRRRQLAEGRPDIDENGIGIWEAVNWPEE
jgi:hypothetical protein